MLSTHAFAESWLKNNLFFSAGFMFANLDDTFTGSRIYGDDFDAVYSSAYPALGYGLHQPQRRRAQAGICRGTST